MQAARPSDLALSPLRLLAGRDLRSFAGLAHPTSLDDVAAVFDLDRSWHGQGALGSARHRTDWFNAAAAGFARGARVWANDGTVVLIDATDVVLVEPLPSLLDALGEPMPEEADDGGPAGDLAIFGDLGFDSLELEAICDDVELYPDEMLGSIAGRLGFSEPFEDAVDAATGR